MSASSLLVELEKRGVAVSFSGDSLLFDAPRGAMRELLPEVARLKPALLEILAHGDRYVSEVPSVAVARGPDDVMAQRVAAQWNATFTPEEIEEYNHAVSMLDAGIDPEGEHHEHALHR